MALLVLVLLCVVLAHAATTTREVLGSRAQQLYDSLSEQEKEYFIRYQLGKAVSTQHSPRLPSDVAIDQPVVIPADIKQKIDEVSNQVSPDFPTKLYQLVIKQYDFTYKQVRSLVREGKVCNAKGICLYPKDVGSNCCPFG